MEKTDFLFHWVLDRYFDTKLSHLKLIRWWRKIICRYILLLSSEGSSFQKSLHFFWSLEVCFKRFWYIYIYFNKEQQIPATFSYADSLSGSKADLAYFEDIYRIRFCHVRTLEIKALQQRPQPCLFIKHPISVFSRHQQKQLTWIKLASLFTTVLS